MPTWLRITILVVIYLIFLFVCCISAKIAIIDNEKRKEDEKRTKKEIILSILGLYTLLAVVGEVGLNFIFFPSYRFLSILKICMHAIYYFWVCYAIVGWLNLKEKIKRIMQAFLFSFGIVSIMFCMMAGFFSSADMYRYENSFWNPVEIVETDYEEYKSVGPTMDVYALDNDKEYNKSIGYNSDTGDYFYYYRGTNTGEIAEKTISKNDIVSKEYLPGYKDTSVVVVKTTTQITRSEFKRNSPKYQTEQTETKYRLYLNTEQIVPVKKD